MPADRATEILRRHFAAVEVGRRTEKITVTHRNCTLKIPPDVFLPSNLGLSDLIEDEVGKNDRVLDMGTGSGINGILAAARSSYVEAVDINPAAVECATQNAAANGVASKMRTYESDLFGNVRGRFDLIIFDPPFLWIRPESLYEQSMVDENYKDLALFFRLVKSYLKPQGRILLAFATVGDVEYLHQLIGNAHLKVQKLRRLIKQTDDFTSWHFAYRLTLMDEPKSTAGFAGEWG